LSHALCDGPPPLLTVTCSGKMILLNTSDASIQCDKLQEPLIENGTSYECRNTCVGLDCENVYRHYRDVFDPIKGPFGSIYFLCEGDSLDEINAYLEYGYGTTTNGTCTASPSATEPVVLQNYHVGRLGVWCPDGSRHDYIYDDTYIGCYSPDTFVQDIAYTQVDDIVVCASGLPCEGTCSFVFSNFFIQSQVINFYETCVESLIDLTSVPTSAPVTLPTDLPFSAQFEASWGSFYNPTESFLSCTGSPNVLIECDSGSKIRLVDSSDSIYCTELSVNASNELLCFSGEAQIANKFASVQYVSDC
jgi:hypothetical protein